MLVGRADEPFRDATARLADLPAARPDTIGARDHLVTTREGDLVVVVWPERQRNPRSGASHQ